MMPPRPGRFFVVGALALLFLSLWPAAAGAATFSNASLSGRYVFSFSGYQFGGPFAAAGILLADGRGNITAGILDQNSNSGGILTAVDFTGSYSIEPDGRGQGTLSSGWGTAEIRFQLISADRAKLIEFDTLSVGAGEIERQTLTSFSDAALSGNYAFLFEGGRYNGWVVTAGRFNADGRGGIYQGITDLNDTGDVITDMALSGSYGLDSSGRGTARLDTWLFSSFLAVYPISASRARFISLDYDASLSGEAELQDNVLFSNASLAGDYVFLMRGVVWNGWGAGAGRLTANGAGTFTAGVFDENAAGSLARNVPLGGAYTVAQNGRGRAVLSSSLGSTRIAFYMLSTGKAKFLTVEPTQASSGVIERQQGAPFRNGSLAGSYGFVSDGFVGRNVAALVGSLNADGEGRVTGTQEVNDGGFLDSAQPVSGSYTVGEDGRGTLTSSDSSGTANLVFYGVSPSRFFLVQMDSFAVLSGSAERLSISAPVVPANGLVNGASFTANMPVTAGAIVSLFGSALAAGTEAASGSPLPTTLGGVTVTVNGVAVPLFFVSPGQINFQLPWSVAGQPQMSLIVTSQGNSSSVRNFALGDHSPGVFQLTAAGQGAVINALTGELAAVAGVMPGMAAPVKRGDYVAIFCTGLGPVSPAPQAGSVSPAEPLAVTLTLPKVTIGGREAPVSFSGLAPGFVGLYQVNAQVPADAASGNAVPLVVSIGGLSSPPVTIAVQ